ncbi:MAG: SDR family NAD(P)-dependent oxidoreductase [Vicinamibacterales bacterium]
MASMVDRTCVVTGATSGIGLETARELASLGANVIIVARDPERGRRVLADLASRGQGREAAMVADLASRGGGAGRGNRHSRRGTARLDVPVRTVPPPSPRRRALTVDGIETQWAVNHLALSLLTNLLLDRLRASAPSRVVVVASCVESQDASTPTMPANPTIGGWRRMLPIEAGERALHVRGCCNGSRARA